MMKDGFTLSSPDAEVRKFWIRHGIACRKIAEAFGRELGDTCITNFWVPDGYKDIPFDRLAPRERLRDSLDEIFAVEIDQNWQPRRGRKQALRHRRGELHRRFP